MYCMCMKKVYFLNKLNKLRPAGVSCDHRFIAMNVPQMCFNCLFLSCIDALRSVPRLVSFSGVWKVISLFLNYQLQPVFSSTKAL